MTRADRICRAREGGPLVRSLLSVRDTTPAAQEMRDAAIRRMEPSERVRLAFAHSEFLRELALTRLRALYPNRTDLELVGLMLGQRLGPSRSPAPPLPRG